MLVTTPVQRYLFDIHDLENSIRRNIKSPIALYRSYVSLGSHYDLIYRLPSRFYVQEYVSQTYQTVGSLKGFYNLYIVHSRASWCYQWMGWPL